MGLSKCNLKSYCGVSVGIKNARSLVEWEIDSRQLDEIIKVSLANQELGDVVNKTAFYTGLHDYKVLMGFSHNLDVCS